MRMSDAVDTETMKVSGAADTSSSPKDNSNSAAKSEVTEQSSKDEHGSNNKRDAQVTDSGTTLSATLGSHAPLFLLPRSPL